MTVKEKTRNFYPDGATCSVQVGAVGVFPLNIQIYVFTKNKIVLGADIISAVPWTPSQMLTGFFSS